MCFLDFYTTQILTSTTVLIECISWLIKVTNNNDARWKPNIKVFIVEYNFLMKLRKKITSEPKFILKFIIILMGKTRSGWSENFGYPA